MTTIFLLLATFMISDAYRLVCLTSAAYIPNRVHYERHVWSWETPGLKYLVVHLDSKDATGSRIRMRQQSCYA